MGQRGQSLHHLAVPLVGSLLGPGLRLEHLHLRSHELREEGRHVGFGGLGLRLGSALILEEPGEGLAGGGGDALEGVHLGHSPPTLVMPHGVHRDTAQLCQLLLSQAGIVAGRSHLLWSLFSPCNPHRH